MKSLFFVQEFYGRRSTFWFRFIRVRDSIQDPRAKVISQLGNFTDRVADLGRVRPGGAGWPRRRGRRPVAKKEDAVGVPGGSVAEMAPGTLLFQDRDGIIFQNDTYPAIRDLNS